MGVPLDYAMGVQWVMVVGHGVLYWEDQGFPTGLYLEYGV